MKEFIFKNTELTNLCVDIKSIELDTAGNIESSAFENDCYKMLFVTEGTIVLSIDGNEVLLRPNKIAIIKTGIAYRLFSVHTKTKTVAVNFNIKEELPDLDEEDYILFEEFKYYVKNINTSGYALIQPHSKNEIMQIVKKIEEEGRNLDIGSGFITNLLILELFAYIARIINKDEEEISLCYDLHIDESMNIAKKYIDNNFNKNLTLKDISKYVYLSESYFSHTFKAKFGISPKYYILKVRVNEAGNLLTGTNMSVNEISSFVGFQSQQRFIDSFKKFKGVTPLKFRKDYMRIST